LHFPPHLSTGATEAISAKHHFELLASSYNRRIKRYHTDKGVFASKAFRDSCLLAKQLINFCGVDAHHQNGIAERYIWTITEHARSMLIHAMIHWPEIIKESFWPYAIQLAVDIHNSTPTDSGLSPLEIFSGTTSSSNPLVNFHPFGCPIFVLEPTLHQNHKIPKWKPRLRMGVYLGHSPDHALSIPLVFSTTTGLVSPQFHLVYDDTFSTVNCLHDNKIPSNCPELFKTALTFYVDEDFNKTNFFHSDTFSDTAPIVPTILQPAQRESPQLLGTIISPPPMEESQSQHIDPTSMLEASHTSSSIHNGWNPLHRYNTCSKKQHIANFTPHLHQHAFSDDNLRAYLSSQDLHPFDTNN